MYLDNQKVVVLPKFKENSLVSIASGALINFKLNSDFKSYIIFKSTVRMTYSITQGRIQGDRVGAYALTQLLKIPLMNCAFFFFHAH
jgi:hypothetical protein